MMHEHASETRTLAVQGLREQATFADAERELRRVHDHESARLLVAFALHAARAELLGGVARCAGLPELERLRAEARDELRLARRDAALRPSVLERCAADVPTDRPACGVIAAAAFALHPSAETRLVLGLGHLVELRDPRPDAFAVLLACARPRPRAIAFELLGFAALLDRDAEGARGAFEAARSLRPTDPRSGWLAARACRLASRARRLASRGGAPRRYTPERDTRASVALRRACMVAELGWTAATALRAQRG